MFRATEITELIFRKYFAGRKMRGNTDDTFFDSINEVFICLVASALRHCLKAWTTGVYVDAPDFKYETGKSKLIQFPTYSSSQVTEGESYICFLNTWEAYPMGIQDLLLPAIKRDLRTRLTDAQPKGDDESDGPLFIEDTSDYERELQRDLDESVNASTLTRRQGADARQTSANYPPSVDEQNAAPEADS
jgi:hypothetical protein